MIHSNLMSISAPAMLNLTTSPNPLSSLSDHSGASTEFTAETLLSNSKHPQQSASTRAVERLTQTAIVAKHSSTEDALKKKMPAAFQLSNKVIPDDAGHIKVNSPCLALVYELTILHLQEALWFHI
jgi:hypothetical protein